METSRFSSSKETAPYTMYCEGNVHCGIWHWWGNSAPRCTSKTDGKHCLLLHGPAAPPLSSAQKKTTTLGGTEPHHSSWECKESHRCCCYGPLAPLEMEDYGTSTVLTRHSQCNYDLFSKVTEEDIASIAYLKTAAKMEGLMEYNISGG